MANQSGKAFSLEIEPYLGKLYRAAFRLTQNRDDAEELVQDTCLRAFARRSSWAGTESPLGWLMRVQYNLFIDGTRKDRSAVVVPIGDEHPSLIAPKRFDPEACASDAEQLAQIHVAWQKLRKEQRALLALRVEGYTLPEIGRITGLSIEALNSRLQRARRSLARLLTNDEGVADTPRRVEIQR